MSIRPLFPFLTILIFFSCTNDQKPDDEPGEANDPGVEIPAPIRVSDPKLPYIDTEFTTDYLMGKFEPAQHPHFTIIEAKYAGREGMFLRKDTYEAFQNMHQAAKADGVNLKILSATRNFNSQKSIWEAKWTGARQVDGMDLSEAMPEAGERALKILEYSSMPGTSRHHWGTDIDLNSLNNAFFEEGEGKKIYDWLTQNAADYGFCQPYTEKGPKRPYGYNEESWHWSYLPVARPLTRLAEKRLKNDMIEGFAGAEAAEPIDVVRKYVLGINPECRK